MFCEVYNGEVISGPSPTIQATKGQLFPVEINREEAHPLTHKQGVAEFSILGDKVVLTFPAIPLEQEELVEAHREMFKTKFSQIRKEKEAAGFECNGRKFDSHRDTQTDMAYQLKNMNVSQEFYAKLTSGEILSVSSEEFREICLAGLEHVQGCFTRQRELEELIDSATTIEDLEILEW